MISSPELTKDAILALANQLRNRILARKSLSRPTKIRTADNELDERAATLLEYFALAKRNVNDLSNLHAAERAMGDDALAEAKAETETWRKRALYMDNLEIKRLTAERDRLAEAARYARDAILSGDNMITAVTTIDEALSDTKPSKP